MKITPLKQFYNNLKASCHNPNNPRYPTYGGAGIKIDPRWLIPGGHGYRTMLDDFDFTQDEDDITTGYIKTIQRYDITKDFTPDNCFLSPHSMCGVPLKDQPAVNASLEEMESQLTDTPEQDTSTTLLTNMMAGIPDE